MKEIVIKSKKYGTHKVLVDDEDYEDVSKYRWHLSVCNHTIYARRSSEPKIMLHRFIMQKYGDIQDKLIDHINHNGLDNKKENLRACTHIENNSNMSLLNENTLKSTSKYKGVSWNKTKSKWVAMIGFGGGKQRTIGYFESEMVAAKAYDQMARHLHKNFACLNFPEIKECIVDIDKILNYKNHTKSKYNGVVYRTLRNTWFFCIMYNGKKFRSKQYKLELDAAEAYDTYIIDNKLEKYYKKLNFPCDYSI